MKVDVNVGLVLKTWCFSVVAHILIILLLSSWRIAPEKVTPKSVVINSYTYNGKEIRQKTPLPTTSKFSEKNHAAGQTNEILPFPVKRRAFTRPKNLASQTKKKKSLVKQVQKAYSRKHATVGVSQNLSASSSPTRLSLAERALASASTAFESPKPRNEVNQISNSITSKDTELIPAMVSEIKSYADGSSLVKGSNGCWKVPPAEARKGSTWLTTSTPCDRDTTVEQIKGILERRRTYHRD